MRLICPQCNALYDVSSAMIPPEGREVECSACGHVWHQPADIREMRGLAGDLRPPAPKSASAAPAVDLGAAPALRRPLPDDVLSILREETARELSARRGVPLEDSPPPPLAPADSPVADARPPDAPKPGAKPKPAKPKPADPALTAVGPPAADWPATTVTAPDDSQPRVITRRQPATPVPARGLRPTPILAKAPSRPLAEDTLAATPTEMPAPVIAPPPALPPVPRRRSVKMLPDAERLAATLQTQLPPPADPPTVSPAPAPTVAQFAPDGYRAGFSRALSVVAALLLAYVAGTAWVGTGGAPSPVVAAVAGIDAARAGLQDVARSLVGQNEKAE
ncbi:zinc-ribbon domain-containing protein [Paracoccus sp. S1E-3]|uniref:zinc-ribbon domain-containing protein n=1 Tax=Paracoccus sp. S1E-3 TaxID=2756130 RepID=UPI0015EED3F2|nr:zinc-ribbon domain-containing protein [Paracoccus sp. S1E-3]MBA4492272.1 zinc-ribbon domain-containing protein [Paracoccus sp. S1E-3]